MAVLVTGESVELGEIAVSVSARGCNAKPPESGGDETRPCRYARPTGQRACVAPGELPGDPQHADASGLQSGLPLSSGDDCDTLSCGVREAAPPAAATGRAFCGERLSGRSAGSVTGRGNGSVTFRRELLPSEALRLPRADGAGMDGGVCMLQVQALEVAPGLCLLPPCECDGSARLGRRPGAMLGELESDTLNGRIAAPNGSAVGGGKGNLPRGLQGWSCAPSFALSRWRTRRLAENASLRSMSVSTSSSSAPSAPASASLSRSSRAGVERWCGSTSAAAIFRRTGRG